MIDVLRNRDITPGHDAVMADIDDTIIFTSGKINWPVVDILHEAYRLGYRVVIITARPGLEGVIEWTQEQLTEIGVPYDALGFTPPEKKIDMKREMGYNFVLSIGDMPTDLTGSQYALKIIP